MISTPYMEGDYIYGVDSYGELRCLDARNGDRVWEDLSAVPKARWATIHMVRNGPRVWMFNERGELVIATLSPTGVSRDQSGKTHRTDHRATGAAGRGLLVSSGLRLSDTCLPETIASWFVRVWRPNRRAARNPRG